MTMHRIVAAEMESGFRLRLRFADGVEGIADFAPLVARGGVYAAIAAAPEAVRIGPHGRSVGWSDATGETVDFCADALRLEIEGRSAAAA
jgi:hypothetical protein